MKRDLYAEVSARIIAELEAGAAPWVKPWSATPGANTPCNAATNRPYSGCNVVLLWMAQQAGYCTPRYLTFKQALEVGGNVRKGEHGTKVYFVKQLQVRDERTEEQEATRIVPMMREYTVFNVDQCEGLPDRVLTLGAIKRRRYYLCGVYIHPSLEGGTLNFVATDGHRLAHVRVPITPAATFRPVLVGPDFVAGALKLLSRRCDHLLQVSGWWTGAVRASKASRWNAATPLREGCARQPTGPRCSGAASVDRRHRTARRLPQTDCSARGQADGRRRDIDHHRGRPRKLST
jgi:hypothetical protein